MSREIVEAVRGLAAEKNISHEKLMEALEDALLSAYKKTPGSAPYAKVEMDRDSGDFKVRELKIPPELEEQLLVDATTDQQPTVDPQPADQGGHQGCFQQHEGPVDHRQPSRPGADQVAVRARGAGDRRRTRRDHRRRPRARLPLQDRGRLACRRRRSRRRLCRPPRL